MALQHLKNKFEPQRVSTHKKSIEVDEYVCTLVQQFIFFMSQGLNQDMWFLWPPRVGSLAPRIPMPPIPRFRATLCFRWLILVFLLIGGKLPTLGIFRSRSVKETICFRCSHFHLEFLTLKLGTVASERQPLLVGEVLDGSILSWYHLCHGLRGPGDRVPNQ